MNNNAILRRLRYTFDYSDAKMIASFDSGGFEATRADVSSWLKKHNHPNNQVLDDARLAAFLNGVINDKRGKLEATQRPPETTLNNNDVLRKLKIALNLKADDMLSILASVEATISKHELSALFRKPSHKHYRECMDQLLRAFLTGLQLKYRDGELEDFEEEEEDDEVIPVTSPYHPKA